MTSFGRARPVVSFARRMKFDGPLFVCTPFGDYVGAIIDRPRGCILRIRRNPMQTRKILPHTGVLQSAANQNRSIAGGDRTLIQQ